MSFEYQLRFPEYFPPLGLYPAGFSFASHLKGNDFGRHTGRRTDEMVARGGIERPTRGFSVRCSPASGFIFQ